MATIEQQWQNLEAEPVSSSWQLMLARPQKGYPLYVALDGNTHQRAILLRAPLEAIPGQQQWPVCRGLLFFTEIVSGETHCGVVLKDTRFADVFTSLAEDLARRIAGTSTAYEAVLTLIAQLARWQKFLAASTDGLCEESQRGLWGELYCLREYLVPAMNAGVAVSGWKGGEHAHQDFQFASGALEVKTTIAKQPQTVRITSERQLDDANLPALFLYVLVLEPREGGAATLPDLVESLRSRLATDLEAIELFEEALLASGYLDAHAQRYVARSYSVRSTHWFRVQKNFPRLVEALLPLGVGDVNYALSLAACEPFITDAEAVLTALNFPH